MLKTDLSSRVVVVTNANTPLGVQLCKHYASNGAKVAVCYDPNGCEKLRDEALAAAGKDAKLFELDFRDREKLDRTGEDIFNAFGKIDILVNNELDNFVNFERKNIGDTDIEKFKSMVEVNIKNFGRFTKKITNYMAKAMKGVLVNITSIKGYIPMEDQSTVVAVASTQVGLGKIWGSELRDYNIRSNVVAVGFSEYEDKAGIPDNIRFSHNPIKRPAKLTEVSDAAMFLSGDESSFITAQILPVDGGLSTGFARSF